jgi:hypothetical protein
VIITIGGGLLGFVAGEMLVTDPVLKGPLAGLGVAFDESGHPRVLGGLSLEILVGLVGAAIVIALGKWIANRKRPPKTANS